VGRIVAYYGVGLVENAVPSYQAEIAPAALRGFISGSLMSIVTLGALWGTGMGKAMADYKSKAGWLIPVGIELIPAAILAVAIPFTTGEYLFRWGSSCSFIALVIFEAMLTNEQ
jgi:SP family sugar:H+ symporter-like MFS transporter